MLFIMLMGRMEVMVKRYPGIAVLGGNRVSALYGVDNGIVDWQGVGIQHFFYQSYEEDLVHSGTSFIRRGDVIEVANRRIDGKSHPIHQHPEYTDNVSGILRTRFVSQVDSKISWVEEVVAGEDNTIIFETTVFNGHGETVEVEVGSYVVLRNPQGGIAYPSGNGVIWEGVSSLQISLEDMENVLIAIESPTGFVFNTMQKLLKRDYLSDRVETENFIGVTLSREMSIPAGESVTIRWGIAASKESYDWQVEKVNARKYWLDWLGNEVYRSLDISDSMRKYYEANLVAIKSALLGGFVPADITGHYFAGGSPSYYARDAMMIARGFLLSGHYLEAKGIIEYLIDRPTKGGSGEFYQRYNSLGEPGEGANNDVFHQLDSQGYFLRNVLTYYQRTGEWLLSFEDIVPYVEVLKKYQGPHGLIGPEGGVNEGVFGPAYIVSSNMFIYGGLKAAVEIAELQGKRVDWSELMESIDRGIQSTWIEDENRYGYGYVEYIDGVVRKYDTPQYFGVLYGYPMTERMRLNNEFLLRYAGFFGDGIGYTEQEYHHGPWFFNTGACAEFQVLSGDYEEFFKKVNWMMDHSNGYCLMPEAIDANNEGHAFINPLTWACAEFVAAVSILAAPKEG